jgi:pimeloyl-ACP methyl ester carboxylesterase
VSAAPGGPALPAAVSGERFEFSDPAAGRLSCYVAGEGPPLLLVHTVNAAASVAEVRPLFEHYRSTRTVFAPDLPGFGFSDRSERAYTPRLMTDALHAVVRQVHARCGPGPVDAIAASLGCEFLARAAVEKPQAFARLALVSPTGFAGTRRRRGPSGSSVGSPSFARRLAASTVGRVAFRALTRPGVVRYFLRRTWGGRDIDEAMWAYAVATARQPGAERAPLHFLAGALFSDDVNTLYDALTQAVWMSHGVRGDFADYRGKAEIEGRPGWRFTVFQTGALPYFEQPAAFCAAFDAFLAAPR